MRHLAVTAGVLSIIVRPFTSLAQKDEIHLTMEQVMTTQEKRDTGVTGLNAMQRAALDAWLNRYTRTVLQVALKESATNSSPGRGTETGSYAGVGSGHWIQDNAHGAIITLEDNSMWQINSLDQVDAILWLATTDITVVKSRSPVGEFKYLLINTEDDERALAKYLGTR